MTSSTTAYFDMLTIEIVAFRLSSIQIALHLTPKTAQSKTFKKVKQLNIFKNIAITGQFL